MAQRLETLDVKNESFELSSLKMKRSRIPLRISDQEKNLITIPDYIACQPTFVKRYDAEKRSTYNFR